MAAGTGRRKRGGASRAADLGGCGPDKGLDARRIIHTAVHVCQHKRHGVRYNLFHQEKPDGAPDGLVIKENREGLVVLDNVSLHHHDGKIVVEGADVQLKPGERVLLAGESGTG